MRILFTGHKGYIGSVAQQMFRDVGHEVVALDTDFFAGCDFGQPAPGIPEVYHDLREVTKANLDGFEAVVHLAALSNDPLRNLDPRAIMRDWSPLTKEDRIGKSPTRSLLSSAVRPQWQIYSVAQKGLR